jgi:hypothetical protein
MRTASHAVQDRVVARFCRLVSLGVIGALAFATLAFEFNLLQTSNIAEPYPMTIYGVLPIPGTARVRGEQGAAGADFSQVYTSALALRHGESAYRTKNKKYADRFGRPPGYPPLMNWIAVPLSYMHYQNAFIVYTLIAVAALLATSAFLLRMLGLRRHIGRVMLAQSSLCFLTPIGLTHLERGQFDLLIATAAALCVGCVFLTTNTLGIAALVGFLGALKWTSVAFLGGFSLLGFLLSSGRKRWSFFLVPVVMLLGTLPFWTELLDYWTTIRVYEIDAEPTGLTLQHFLPRNVARAIPLLMTLIIAGVTLLRFRSAADRDLVLKQISAPFAIALTNVAVCFGTLSYEYHTVTTLGMIPPLVIWTRCAHGVPHWLKASACVAFGLFLIVAFRTYGFGSLAAETMTEIYAGVALLFFATSLYVAGQPRLTIIP